MRRHAFPLWAAIFIRGACAHASCPARRTGFASLVQVKSQPPIAKVTVRDAEGHAESGGAAITQGRSLETEEALKKQELPEMLIQTTSVAYVDRMHELAANLLVHQGRREDAPVTAMIMAFGAILLIFAVAVVCYSGEDSLFGGVSDNGAESPRSAFQHATASMPKQSLGGSFEETNFRGHATPLANPQSDPYGYGDGFSLSRGVLQRSPRPFINPRLGRSGVIADPSRSRSSSPSSPWTRDKRQGQSESAKEVPGPRFCQALIVPSENMCTLKVPLLKQHYTLRGPHAHLKPTASGTTLELVITNQRGDAVLRVFIGYCAEGEYLKCSNTHVRILGAKPGMECIALMPTSGTGMLGYACGRSGTPAFDIYTGFGELFANIAWVDHKDKYVLSGERPASPRHEDLQGDGLTSSLRQLSFRGKLDFVGSVERCDVNVNDLQHDLKAYTERCRDEYFGVSIAPLADAGLILLGLLALERLQNPSVGI